LNRHSNDHDESGVENGTVSTDSVCFRMGWLQVFAVPKISKVLV
jgi:hypothetical protein